MIIKNGEIELWLVVVFCVALPTGKVYSDTIFLKGGGRINDCRTLDDDPRLPGKLLLRTPGGRMGVPKEAILRIQRQRSTFDVYDKKRSQIHDNDYLNLYLLSKWCRERAGLREETYKLLERVIVLKKDHTQARHLLGYIWYNNQWVKLPPLSISFRLNKKMKVEVNRHLSILLETRDDIKIVDDLSSIKAGNSCELITKISTGTSPGAIFYGLQVQGPTAHASIELKASGSWIGNFQFKISMHGEVRASTPNARIESINDGFTRNAKKVHDFFDEILLHRVKVFEAAGKKKEPSPEKKEG